MKKVLALLLAMVLMLSLAACGKPNLESITTEGIYYKEDSDTEIHYVFKDGIVTKKIYKAIPYSQSGSGKLNSLSSEKEIAKYKDLTDTTVTIIEDNNDEKYTYRMDEDSHKVLFTTTFLDSGKTKFEMR